VGEPNKILVAIPFTSVRSVATIVSIYALSEVEYSGTLDLLFLIDDDDNGAREFINSHKDLLKIRERFNQTYVLESKKHAYVIQTIADQRNNALCFARRNGYDALFFVDSDIVVKPNILNLLLSVPSPLAYGYYCFRMFFRSYESLSLLLNERFYSYSCDGINLVKGYTFLKTGKEPFQVEFASAGCMLIKKEALYDERLNFNINDPRFSEDFNYVIKARRFGYRPMVHPGGFCTHQNLLTQTPAKTIFLINVTELYLKEIVSYLKTAFWLTTNEVSKENLIMPQTVFAKYNPPIPIIEDKAEVPLLIQLDNDKFFVISGLEKVSNLKAYEKIKAFIWTPMVKMKIPEQVLLTLHIFNRIKW